MERIFFGIVSFCFGAIVGSFLNVVILRKNTGEKIVNDRSRCFSCNKTIYWYDNIPLISFFALGGRCRGCRSKISWQYPIVEFLTGLLALAVFNKVFFFSSQSIEQFIYFIFYFTAFAALFAVAVYDARTKIIDRHLLNIFACFAVLSALTRWWQNEFSLQIIFYDIAVAGMIWFFFWAMCYFSGETWMGRGDSDVAWWCAIFLGSPLSVVSLLFSFWIGGVFGAILLILHQIKILQKRISKSSAMKMQIPFAPFLASGAFIAWYISDILNLFYRFFLW